MRSYSLEAARSGIYFNESITITSKTGVGSSSTIQALRKVLEGFGITHWRFVSGGAVMRHYAQTLGMTIDEFAAHNRAHPEEGWDKKCDEMIAQFGKQNFTVIEGRLPHVFAPHSFHVLLTCEAFTRAMRRAADTGRVTQHVYEEIVARDKNDDLRYERLYPDCLWPKDHFDLVLDTGEDLPYKIVKKILEGLEAWVKKKEPPQSVISDVNYPL